MLTDGGSLGGGVELDNRSGRPPTAPVYTGNTVTTTGTFSFHLPCLRSQSNSSQAKSVKIFPVMELLQREINLLTGWTPLRQTNQKNQRHEGKK